MNALHNGFSQRDWLALSFMPGIGPSRLASLWTYLSAWSDDQEDGDLFASSMCSVKAAQSVDYQVLRALGWSERTARAALLYLQKGKLPYDAEDNFTLTERWLEASDQQVIFRDDPDYPSLLQNIAVPPTCLFVKGDCQAWAKPCIGVVGARNASGYGKRIAESFALQLAEAGYSVCSGGAKGIDAFAHQGALQAQQPTVAVMGTGLLNLYPKQNTALFERILAAAGALISEYPLTTAPRPNLFPPRNRIISGMSHGVLVVEASQKSGSLISARYALEENREVFAIPGRIGDPQASGTNQLIRQGASLVLSIDDIMAELPRALRQPALEAGTTLSEEVDASNLSRSATGLLEVLSREREAFDFDALIRKTGMGAADLSQTLMELELSGMVVNAQGHYQCAP
ncbi:hypothetical protein MAQ5080_01770 [Marinomonas aquimarina]|uniref:Uncharacterized protein n=1 Tax=Marinomonas aquimarina TaxID=295068 RepID=A0A1A8TFA1_9GAMM|nr:DNA-processing protein DprA [Marinomonas aquimarina]SBS30826.1 hypothetical protein MAQ5080_01770 [Marinomonas aquimarina]